MEELSQVSIACQHLSTRVMGIWGKLDEQEKKEFIAKDEKAPAGYSGSPVDTSDPPQRTLPKAFEFSLDGKTWNRLTNTMTGKEIYGLLPAGKLGYSLFEERDDEDRQISFEDKDVIVDGASFYSVPPATFGADGETDGKDGA